MKISPNWSPSFTTEHFFPFFARCPSSWKLSRPTWKNLPANINKRSARTHSSGSSFRKCVPPSALTRLHVRMIWDIISICFGILVALEINKGLDGDLCREYGHFRDQSCKSEWKKKWSSRYKTWKIVFFFYIDTN